MKIEIRTCPFCGGTPSIEQGDKSMFGQEVIISCKNLSCPAQPSISNIGRDDALKEAIAIWGKRP